MKSVEDMQSKRWHQIIAIVLTSFLGLVGIYIGKILETKVLSYAPTFSSERQVWLTWAFAVSAILVWIAGFSIVIVTEVHKVLSGRKRIGWITLLGLTGFWITLLLGVDLMSRAILARPLPEGRITDVNRGTVCLMPTDSPSLIRGLYYPDLCNCYAHCQHRITYGSVVVMTDNHGHSIKIETDLAAESYFSVWMGCPEECAVCPGDAIEFTLSELEDSTYSLWLGDNQLDDLSIPLADPVCQNTEGSVSPNWYLRLFGDSR